MSKLLLVGDSNVRRFFYQLGSAYTTTVDFCQARSVAEWSEAVPTCMKGYDVVVYSFFTNLIVDAGREGPKANDRLESIEAALRAVITEMK